MRSNGEQTKAAAASGGISVRAVIGLLILTNALVYQLSTLNRTGGTTDLIHAATSSIGIMASAANASGSVRGSATSSSTSSRYALEIPQGEAEAMPSVRISEEESAKDDRTLVLRFSDLLKKCLALDPTRRISVKAARTHDFFKE